MKILINGIGSVGKRYGKNLISLGEKIKYILMKLNIF